MSLLEKLAERQYNDDFNKIAEDIFLDAICDELDKLGYEHISSEMLKKAGVGTFLKGVVGKAKGLLKKVPSTNLQVMQHAQKARLAGKASVKKYTNFQSKNVAYGTIRKPLGK